MNENLKPFQKGQSGNPKGRPKKIPSLETLLRESMLEEIDGMPAIHRIILTLRQQAIEGDQKAAEYLINRLYGKTGVSIASIRENPDAWDLDTVLSNF